MTTTHIYSPLPKDYFPDSNPPRPIQNFQENCLVREVRQKDRDHFGGGESWSFILDRLPSASKRERLVRKKKTFLTRKERLKLAILKLPKGGWNYTELEPIRRLWKLYMRDTLTLLGNTKQNDLGAISGAVSKSELLGAEVMVIMSKTASLVGLSGTLVLETKQTFQLVTKKSQLKIVPKISSVFEFYLDQYRFKVYGKHLVMKPSERTVKKVKTRLLPTL